MCKNPSSVVLNLGCILGSKFWEVWKITISMLHARSIKSKFWTRNTGTSIFFSVVLFLTRVLKKFPRSFQCAANTENHCLGDSGHQPVWKPLFLHTNHQPGLFQLMCYPESTFCLLPLLLFSSSFCFILFRKRYFSYYLSQRRFK